LKGLSALITAGQFPDDCPFCKFGIDDEQRAWLADRRDLFRGPPELERLAHWGSYVLVRAESSDGGYAVECLFEGMNPVRLDRCWEVQSRGQASDPSEEGSQNQAAVPLPSVAVTEKSLSGRTEAASEGRAPEPRLDSAMWDPSDRLGPPPMSDPPTQVELGHYAYYISCMVCHGDQGQGLEEWRTVLPEEDRDCWQSRCHAANHPPEGFQLPNYAPPLVGPGTLAGFSTAADLHGYMAARMPWQAPGFLPDEEYWQITSFLIKAHGAEPGDELLTPERAAAIPLP
jgi:mono/diheme cytochrome c family protein